MEYIILGQLLLNNRTIYQLRERINKGLNLMYSSSMGSIQAAIKKLLSCGSIEYIEVVENGKYKKVYSITDTGKQSFFEWINSPIEIHSSKNPELTKIYYMGFADEESREVSLEKYLSHLNEQYQVLNMVCMDADNVQVPKELKDIAFFQLATARYGRDFMRFNIEWCKNLLKEIRSKKNESV